MIVNYASMNILEIKTSIIFYNYLFDKMYVKKIQQNKIIYN